MKSIKVLKLKREFELLKMKKSGFIKEYSSKLIDLMNKMKLLGEDFTDQKMIEKMLMSSPS